MEVRPGDERRMSGGKSGKNGWKGVEMGVRQERGGAIARGKWKQRVGGLWRGGWSSRPSLCWPPPYKMV